MKKNKSEILSILFLVFVMTLIQVYIKYINHSKEEVVKQISLTCKDGLSDDTYIVKHYSVDGTNIIDINGNVFKRENCFI